MARFYPDTSIWLDYYEKRGANGIAAANFLAKLIQENHLIGFSDLTTMELKNLGYSKVEISRILKVATAKNSKRLHITKEQIDEARKISETRNIPRKDALHAILCRDNDFQLIGRDKHFQQLKDIAETKAPEEVI